MREPDPRLAQRYGPWAVVTGASDGIGRAFAHYLAESLRVEWAPLGVDVVASAPGPIRTGFAARANLRMARALPAEVVARATMQALGRKTTVRPGWLSTMLGWSLALLPRWAQVMVITQVMKGMTAHQGRSGPRIQTCEAAAPRVWVALARLC